MQTIHYYRIEHIISGIKIDDMGKSDVVVVGGYNQDLTWYTPVFPHPGETVMGQFITGPGGKGSNQAFAAARSGVTTAFVGAIGDDHFGKPLPELYEREGIEHHLCVKTGHPTGNAGIWVDGNGRNDIIVALGANMELLPSDIPESLIASAKVVICQHECNLLANHRAFEIARNHGVKTILNPAPTRNDFDEGILKLVDILVPNEPEFASLVARMNLYERGGFSEDILMGLRDEDLHELCLKLSVPVVVVTLGKRGCLVSTQEEYQKIPAMEVDEVVDTCGAGDAFVGGLAAGLARYDGNISKAAEFATIVAGLSVTCRGTSPAMPDLEKIKPHLISQGLD